MRATWGGAVAAGVMLCAGVGGAEAGYVSIGQSGQFFELSFQASGNFERYDAYVDLFFDPSGRKAGYGFVDEIINGASTNFVSLDNVRGSANFGNGLGLFAGAFTSDQGTIQLGGTYIGYSFAFDPEQTFASVLSHSSNELFGEVIYGVGPVPLPASFPLFGAGLLVLGGLAYVRRSHASLS